MAKHTLTFESQPVRQTALALGAIVIGLTLAIGFRHFEVTGMTNSLAGFLLGMLLLLIGFAGILVVGKQTIIVDPWTRCISVEDASTFWSSKRIIPFSNIVRTGISYVGQRTNHVNFYYITLHLRDGETYPLFAPGRFFEGGSDRTTMEERRIHLQEIMAEPQL